MFFRIELKDGTTLDRSVAPDDSGRLVFPASAVPADACAAELHDERFSAKVGDEGFFLIPDLYRDACLTSFGAREDGAKIFRENDMPIYAAVRGQNGFLAVVSGMEFEFGLKVELRAGVYTLRPRFLFADHGAYEDIVIDFIALAGDAATPGGVARRYRKLQLDSGAWQTLRERASHRPVLAAALRGPEVRVRMAWKPQPPEVVEQTEANEPELHVALTFDRACDMLEAFKARGIEDAEFCLVGWNKSGHDGRFPDLLPVEPKLGGEAGLRKFLQKAKSLGYRVGAHTNLHDSYTLARRFDRADLVEKADHTPELGGKWSGGQSYLLCPRAACEKLLQQDLATVANLGFDGTHYFDVLSLALPSPCFAEAHPLTRKGTAAWRNRILDRTREKFGAVSSEGSCGFSIGHLDYALYVIFSEIDERPAFCDRFYPLRRVACHGIIHYNSHAATANAGIKQDKRLSLLNLALGGRPLFYYYSKFRKASPLGDEDLLCGSEKELHDGVDAVARECGVYNRLRDLQYEFIDEIEEPEKNIWITAYANGSVTVANATDKTCFRNGVAVEPFSIVRVDAQQSSEGRSK